MLIILCSSIKAERNQVQSVWGFFCTCISLFVAESVSKNIYITAREKTSKTTERTDGTYVNYLNRSVFRD